VISGQNLYYDLVSILRNAGCTVQENSITNGWQRRARSSGGFPAAPIATFWHHTASNTSVENDLNYMINVNSDAPVGNLLLDRNGVFWPIAGGASNCAGKGRAMTFSRGTGASDSGNTWAFQVECQNDGLGQPWEEVQILALAAGSNALNAFVHNQPSDITSHALGSGNGYTDRKIDPSQAAAVQGAWRPRSTNSSGTWELADMRTLALQCATQEEPDMTDDQAAQLARIEQTTNGLWTVCNNTNTYIWGTDQPGSGMPTPAEAIMGRLSAIESRLDALEC